MGEPLPSFWDLKVTPILTSYSNYVEWNIETAPETPLHISAYTLLTE